LDFFTLGVKQKKMEEQLAAANRRIEALREEAKIIADSAGNSIILNVAHELRTPFNAIIGFSEMILDRQFGDLTSLQEEYLGDIVLSARSLFTLINDILDLSRVESDALELETSDVKMEDLVQRCLALVKEKALKHGIKLTAEVNAAAEPIEGDERKLKRILFNLLAGAIRFTPDGGEVRLNVEMTEHDVLISVEDTGCGIREQDLESVFTPLRQEDGTPDDFSRRSQPGLYLARKLVELHGGRIWAESQGVDKGTSFRFTIPGKRNLYYS